MLEIRRFGGHLGADVRGVDLSRPLSSDDVEAIRAAHLEHIVLFFRDQKLLTFAAHKALAAQFGELETTTYQRQNVDDKIQYPRRRGRGQRSPQLVAHLPLRQLVPGQPAAGFVPPGTRHARGGGRYLLLLDVCGP